MRANIRLLGALLGPLVLACGGNEAPPPATAVPTAMPVASTPAPKVASAEPSAKPATTPPPENKPTPEQAKTVDAFGGDFTFDAIVTAPGGKPIQLTIYMSC